MSAETLPPTPPTGSPWTLDQWEAIRSRDQSLLLAAAAGAGKTATLVERIIRRLLDPAAPVEIDRLLVVTFTEAAAAEMRGRIAAALEKSLAREPESTHLRRQMALLERAPISTLHSFCLSLLRQSFHQLQLDPAFRVMSEHEALLMRQEVLDQVFERMYGAEEPGPFLALVDRYGGHLGDDALRQLVLDLYDYARSTPWPEEWLDETVRRLALPPDAPAGALAHWTGPLLRDAAMRLEQIRWQIDEALSLANRPDGPTPYGETLEQDREQLATLRELAQNGDWEGLAGALTAFTWGSLKRVKAGSCDPLLQEQVKQLREAAKRSLKSLQEDGVLTQSLAAHAEELRLLAPHMQTLVDLVKAFDAAFSAAKAEAAQVDFSDLERYALQVLRDPESPPGELRPSPLARELRRRFAEVLVDEYQDINAVQDAILTLVSRDGGEEGPPNRFMVGDVKQSIYRFRLAEPRLFLGKYRRFPADPAALERRIDLQANFRSRPGVIHAVNFLFRQIMTPGAGELAYDQAAELVAGARYPEPPPGVPAGEAPVELWVLDRSGGEAAGDAAAGLTGDLPSVPAGAAPAASADDAEAEPGEDDGAGNLSTLEAEARLVAQRLRSWKESGLQIWDKDLDGGAYRPLRWRDVVVLLRATRQSAQTVVEVLQAAGIPAYGEAGTGYFEAPEVQTILALLQIIDNPRQDIPLAAVLRSPLVGLELAPEELARIRLCDRRGSFYDAVLQAAAPALGQRRGNPGQGVGSLGPENPVSAELAGRLAGFVEQLDRWRTLARQQPLGQVLWQLYEETGYLYYVAGLPGGGQRRANLLALFDRARQFDQFARQGLFRFLRFVENLRARGEDIGPAPAISESADVVRVMSIHKSKGLEFPLVFLLGLGRKFNTQDESAPVLRHRDLGLGPAVVNPEQRYQYPSLAHRAIGRQLHSEMLAEEMRILYVALTRARERLVLVGSLRNVEQAMAGWVRNAGVQGWPLPDAALTAARCYLDWIGPALIRHRDGESLLPEGWVPPPAFAPAFGDPSRWQVRILPAGGLAAEASPPEAVAQTEAAAGREGSLPGASLPWERILALQPLEPAPHPTPERAALADRLTWQYPHRRLTRLPAKETVTGVKHLFATTATAGHGQAGVAPSPAGQAAGRTPNLLSAEEYPSDEERLAEPLPPEYRLQPMARPRFLQERRTLTPAERGTVTHLFLQHLPLEPDLTHARLQMELDRLIRRELLTREQADAIDLESVAAFFRSPLGERLTRQPERVRRELAFTYSLPAREIDPELPAGPEGEEPVLLQGMIDCLIAEPTGLVLIDFKTDRLRPDQVEEAVIRYSGQLALYARAISEIWRQPVAEAWLYFLAPARAERVLLAPPNAGKR